MVSTFFSDKPIELLLGSGIEASQLNDTVLGRLLDSIHRYGCTSLYANLAPQICERLGLCPKALHMDSTDFHLEGRYNSEQESVEDNVLHLCKGYSRDHRPDLNQVVLNLIVENEAGIVLHMEGLSGNTSDKTAFNQTIRSHINQLQTVYDIDFVVFDSAGYTEKTLTICGTTTKWVSRVPETLKESKLLIAQDHQEWQVISEEYKYVALSSQYADIAQRWLLIFSKEAYYRELITLKKQYLKGSDKEYSDFLKLCKQKFSCKKDAQKAVADFIKRCKYITVNNLTIKEIPVFDKKGRPKKGENPIGYDFYIQAEATCKISDFQTMAHTKGKFIIATNELNKTQFCDELIFQTYKGQAKVEKGFRFLKDPQFIASSLFVKKPQRVEALLFIMTLCLTVYAAIEYKIRKKLKENDQTLPNQLGKQIKNPTARWIFACFTGIHVLYFNNQATTININPFHINVLNLMGLHYKKYYFRE
jgi:transposase